MSIREVTIAGMLRPDGTLQLDQNPELPPGRITVVLRQETEPELPCDDPFWQRMQNLWSRQKAQGHVPRSAIEIAAEQQVVREEWDEHQQELEHLQEDRQAARRSQAEPPS